jgi:Amidohydrolase family
MTKACLLVTSILAIVGLVRAEVPSAVAIKDARVVTVSGAELPKATVLLRNGLIEDVGPNLTIPADAWVIDGSSLVVYPGFIDGLSTWGIPELAAPAPATSRTATPTPAPTPPPLPQAPRAHGPDDRPQTFSYDRAADMIKPSDRRLEGARSAGFTSSATFPNRGIIAGLGAMVNLAGDRGSDMVVAQPIGEQIILRTAGFRAGFPNSLMGVLAYVRQVYLDSEQYKQAKLIYSSRVSGQERPPYDHYLEGLAEAPRILLPAMEAQQIDRIIAFSAELKQPTVLYGLHEAFKRISEIKQSNLPVLVSLKWPEKSREANPADVPSLRDLELRANAPAVPGLLAKAGVKFALYSDTVDQPADLKKAIKKAIDAGLSRADAIRALTLSTAEIYGLSDRLGSIDKGKIANLVVMKGEAFEEKTTVEYVFVDGKLFKPSKEPPALPAGTPQRPARDDGDRNEVDGASRATRSSRGRN